MRFRAWATLLILLAFCAGLQADSASAHGGNISQIGLTISGYTDRWHLFYGNTSNTSNTNATLLLNSSVANDSSDSSRLLTLSSTYKIYLISDSPNPFNGTLMSPNQTAFDDKYGLPSNNSVSLVFNDSSSFAIYNTATGSLSANLTLPTLYLAGGSDPMAFSEGLAQVNGSSSFVFVVPIANTSGFDNRTFDFEFALPYVLLSSSTFYVFSVLSPSTAAASTASSSSGGTGASQPPSSQLSFDGRTLTIRTAPGASVVLHDSLGKVYNFVADAGGIVRAALPSGTRYTLTISSGGGLSSLDSIFLPSPVYVPPPAQPAAAPGQSGGTSPATPAVTVDRTPEGIRLCSGGECYIQPSGSWGVEPLTELSCSGSICRFVGTNTSEFVKRQGFTPVGVSITPGLAVAVAPSPANIARALQSIGTYLSAQFGSPLSDAGPRANWPMTATLAVLLGAGAILILFHPLSQQKPRGGYD